ncbi:MAG: BlaI/MecI/CopY family transcriptional regulator [Clostridiales bacterium]|jgi:predicted transcriptional regulator|nr:BlaI/MecI/CopY family transcriptional regulator [Clostridiales bacterium]MDR2711646.1 BlaI/MecI/CopY family transcriptional regulator [Clostridiales bacterium]
MKMRLADSDLKIMEILWREGPTTAKKIGEILFEQTGWRKTTAYTVIKYCINKGAIRREEPFFVCHPLITKEQAQEMATTKLINTLYEGAPEQLVAFVLGSGSKKYSPEEIGKLRELVDNLAQE